MSTYELFEDFFPTALAAVETLAPGQPVRMFGGAPGPVFKAGPLHVRTPLLLPLAVAGAAIGLAGFRALSRAAGRRGSLPAQPVWAMGFLYFAGMNLSAIICHCLAPRGTLLARVFASLDVAFTGCSSACLALASLAGLPKPPPAAAALARARAEAWLWAPVAAATLAGNLGFPHLKAGLNENVYITTTAAAAAILFLCEVLTAPPRSAEAAAVRASGWGAVALFGSAAVDRALRAATGGWVSAVHVAFAACDVAFACLSVYVRAKGRRVSQCDD